MTKHNHEKCDAPICVTDPNYKNNTWSWFPDETICHASPQGHLQKVQKKIQKLFKKGKVDNKFYFTSKMLEKIIRVGEGIKGRNPNRRHYPTTHPETSNTLGKTINQKLSVTFGITYH